MTTLQKQIKKTADKINEFRGMKGFDKIRKFCVWLKSINKKFEIDEHSGMIFIIYPKKQDSLEWYISVNSDNGFTVGDENDYSEYDAENSISAINYLIEELKTNIKGIPDYLDNPSEKPLNKEKPRQKIPSEVIEFLDELVSLNKNLEYTLHDKPQIIYFNPDVQEIKGFKHSSFKIEIPCAGFFEIEGRFFSNFEDFKYSFVEKLMNCGVEFN